MRMLAKAALMLVLAAGGAYGADGPTTAPAEKAALVVMATVAGPVKAGDKVTVTVEVKNTSDGVQTIDIPSMWWAKSDNARWRFRRGRSLAGLGR